jgi:hypothetical protein
MADLENSCKTSAVKPISDTCWDCRIDSVKVVQFQTAAVYNALVEVTENVNNQRTEATVLAKQLKSFPFLVTLAIWHYLLAQINIVSIFNPLKLQPKNWLKN